ncbi:MAG: helix-turn-helix domain-containing protein [Akkermansiaceae bacterium]|nr:helix-turn-helix domain-containing protein [Akkermansiaceae bacterium]
MTTSQIDQLPAEGLVTLEPAAAFLAISKRATQDLVADGLLASVKIGRSRRFDVADLRRFVEDRKVKARGWKPQSRN